MARNMVYKLNTVDNSLIKLTNVNPIKENNGEDIVWLHADYGNDVAKIKFVPQVFLNKTNTNPIPAIKMTRETDQEIIDAIIPEGYQELGWSTYYFRIESGISGILKSMAATTYGLATQQLEVDLTDEDYIGFWSTASTSAVTIDTELKAQFPLAVEGNYVNVYQTTTNIFHSWIYTSGTWLDDGKLLNSQVTSNSQAIIETFKATVASNDDFNMGTPEAQALVFNQLYAEIEELSTIVAGIVGDVGNLMIASDYDDEGTATKSVKYARNIGVDGASKPATEVIAGEFPNIDYNAGSVGGQNSWNPVEQAIDTVINADVTLQNGRELLKKGRNATGVTILNGSVVAIIGSIGNVAEIELVDINDYDQSFKVIGIATEDILNNTDGNITLIGRVRGLDTSMYAEGTILYAGENGTLTDVCPTPPKRCILIAVVETSNAGAGILWTWPRPIAALSELSDTIITNPQIGDKIYWNGTTFVNITDTLNNMVDVNVPNPDIGEVLQWNGLEWVSGDVATTGAGKSITLYIEDINSSVVPYETLQDFPAGLPEEDDSVAVTAGTSPQNIGGYITEELKRTKIEAGNWVFENFARVSSVNGVSTITIDVYKRSNVGVETLLFSVTTEEINSTSNMAYAILTTQPEYALVETDRLLVKYSASTTSVASVTVTLVHSGTQFASHIDTPLQTLHNDLASIQGGNSTERYHLSLAQINYLIALSTTAGAGLVGYDGSTGFVGKTTIQEALDQAKLEIDQIVAGSVADNSLTEVKFVPAVREMYNRVIELTHNANGDFYANITTLEDRQKVTVKFPTMITDLTEEVRISLDNQVTYYPAKVKDTNNVLLVNDAKEEIMDILRSGTDIIVNRQSPQLSPTQTYPLSTQSQLLINPVENSPFGVEKITGESSINLVAGEAVPNGNSVQFNSVTGVKYLDTFTGAFITGDDTTKTITNNSGVSADMMIIPMLSTSQLALTIAEALNRYNTYFDGLVSAENVNLKVNNKNLFDINGTQISRSGFDNSDVTIANDRMTVKTVTENITMILVKVQPNKQYFIKANEYNLTIARIRIYEYSSLPVETLEGTLKINGLLEAGQAVTTASDTQYIGIGLYLNGLAVNDYIGQIQLEEGSSASSYLKADLSEQTWKATLRSAIDVADYIDENGKLNTATGYVASESIGATINYVDMPTGGVFIAVDTITYEYQTGVKGDTLTLTNASTVIYELTTEVKSDIDIDGLALAYDNMTIEITNDNGFAVTIEAKHSYNTASTLDNVIKEVQESRRQIDLSEDEITTLQKLTPTELFSGTSLLSTGGSTTGQVTLSESIDNFVDSEIKVTYKQTGSSQNERTLIYRLKGGVVPIQEEFINGTSVTSTVKQTFKILRIDELTIAFYEAKLETITTTPTFSKTDTSDWEVKKIEGVRRI